MSHQADWNLIDFAIALKILKGQLCLMSLSVSASTMCGVCGVCMVQRLAHTKRRGITL